jgi:hypothetical protein
MLASTPAQPDAGASLLRGRGVPRLLPGGGGGGSGGETPRGLLAVAMRHRRSLVGAYILALHTLAYVLMTHASAARRQCVQA